MTNNRITTRRDYTILLLCIGYFIDFYDLSIFGSSYTTLIKEQFNVQDPIQIQQLYLYISNWHSAGLLIGAITFGILGDKLGRASVIRYSIMLYSIAILMSIITTSIPVFCVLRFLTGAGLACEFATSNVLISELVDKKSSNKGAAILYASGIIGGLTSVFFASFSWKFMFFFGGISGIALYLARKNLHESNLFLITKTQITKNSILQLMLKPQTLIKTGKLLLLILPFQLVISMMFILPTFMHLHQSLHESIQTLLLGFFLGGLTSAIASIYIINRMKNYTWFLFINLSIMLVILLSFSYTTDNTVFIYFYTIGLTCGAYPTIWMQLSSKSYGTNIRSTAANSLFAVGRSSGIIFNLIISYCLVNKDMATHYFSYLFIFTISIAIISLLHVADSYHVKLNYSEV